jgi:phosphorylcholine metabolism protein LicD
MRNEFQKKAEVILKEVVSLFEKNDIHYCLACGTLLGAIRDGDFIKHDSDIDLILTEPLESDKVRGLLLENGYKRIHRFGSTENGLECSFEKNGIKTDLFYLYKDDEKCWISLWKPTGSEERKQLFYDFPLWLFQKFSRFKFRGVSMNMPASPEKYLRIHYGDWREIVKDWRWDESPKCLRR